jgi:hypothetical protein
LEQILNTRDTSPGLRREEEGEDGTIPLYSLESPSHRQAGHQPSKLLLLRGCDNCLHSGLPAPGGKPDRAGRPAMVIMMEMIDGIYSNRPFIAGFRCLDRVKHQDLLI